MVYILENRWQTWIKDNVQRGCTKPDMLKVMTDAGIVEETAQFNLMLYEASTNPKSHNSSSLKSLTQSVSEQPSAPDSSYLFQHENTIKTSDGQCIQVTMRCNTPDIVLLDNFMSAAECDALCELSKDTLTTSSVIDDATGDAVAHEARTSQGTYFTLGKNALVKTIETRINEMTGIPVEHGEGIQILNYIDGGEYKPHFDYFPDNEGGHANMTQGGQRIITVVMYLNDVDTGGATVFPEINLNIYPKKGSAIYFSYFNASGQVDPLTLHGGAPVIKGEKWIATKWLREQIYQ